MLNKQEELFVKRIVALEFEKCKLSIIKDCEEDLKEHKGWYIDQKGGYEIMTDYDTSCTFIPMYEQSFEFATEMISSHLPKKLREKVKKEHIDLSEYWSDMFNDENFDFTSWWNQMISLTYMEFASQYFDTVEEVNEAASPDMNYWGGDNDDLKEQMDKDSKGIND